ncbi:protein kinase family protein [Natronoglycomyces albus]|uniref:non-specific serine/threonine protein kinase n=1 Tax=Natronoglycomyces albus TaxID=2811108 RepID=A0A895XHQ1_9ACTN|nr:protein kinase family protein [Natronoglycomyces albus]QSB05361.1 protein kinase family protein [Natronoglycomyces albus]
MTDVDVPSTGDLLADRYRLDEPVNVDTDGREVWRGLDVLLNRKVAVVINTPGGSEAAPMMEAAVATSRIGHASLVDVYDAVDEGRLAYVVREWVEGQSLREILEHGPLDGQQARDILSSVAGAVAAVHAQGISHSNIHPGTILFSEDDRVMVTEPRSKRAGEKADDVRAIGATLYACVTGQWPHNVPGSEGLPVADPDESTGEVRPPKQLRSGLPQGLNSLVMSLLAAEPYPSTASELAAELRKDANQLAADTTFHSAAHDTVAAGGSVALDATSPDLPPQRTDTAESLLIAEGKPGEKRQEDAPAGMRRLAMVAAAIAGVALVGVLASAVITQGGGADPDNAGLVGTDDDDGESEEEEQTSVPERLELDAAQIRIVDPPDSSRSELQGTEFLIDNDSSTGWSTQTYYNHANFGNLKPGMGILMDLRSEQEIASVRLHMTEPGATVGLRAGDVDPGSSESGDQQIADNYTEVVAPIANVDANLELTLEESVTTQYLMVWITELPPVSGGYKLTVSDINVYVR